MIVFSRWQKRVVVALMLCDERWAINGLPKGPGRWSALWVGRTAGGCSEARHHTLGWLWRHRARLIERRWPRVWGAWLESGLWRGDWRANLTALDNVPVDHGPDDDMGGVR